MYIYMASCNCLHDVTAVILAEALSRAESAHPGLDYMCCVVAAEIAMFKVLTPLSIRGFSGDCLGGLKHIPPTLWAKLISLSWSWCGKSAINFMIISSFSSLACNRCFPKAHPVWEKSCSTPLLLRPIKYRSNIPSSRTSVGCDLDTDGVA